MEAHRRPLNSHRIPGVCDGVIVKAVQRFPDGTWGPPRILYDMSKDAGIPKVVANKVVVLSSGEWVLPFWRQRSYQVCDQK